MSGIFQSDHRFLVTGAGGFIGGWLVKSLLDQGSHVRALIHRNALDVPPGFEAEGFFDHRRLEVESHDVTDIQQIDRLMQGCTHVFHLAALARNWTRDAGLFGRINIEGTRNVLTAARRHDVQKVVATSTYVTFGPSLPGQLVNEHSRRSRPRFFNDYERTKHDAEALTLEFARQGLDVVIVCPTRVFGPGHLTESNSVALLMHEYLSGRMPWLFNRGVNVGNYVLVSDVVEGHLLAMQKGACGQRYILGDENWSLRELADQIDRISGRRHLRIPLWKAGPMLFSYVELMRAKLTGRHPKVTPGWMRMFMADWACDCTRARDELGYQPGGVAAGLEATYRWLESLESTRQRF